MDFERLIIRLSAGLLACAIVLRLAGTHFFDPALQWLSRPEVQSFLIYLETGRKVRFSPSLQQNTEFVGESVGISATLPTELPALPCFAPQDAEAISLTDRTGKAPDIAALLSSPLSWDLTADSPAVLIVHTHTTESYTKTGEIYEESAAYRTLNEQYNMLSIGDRVAEILSSKGIGVIHDRELHDYPSYNGSYTHARQSIAYYLQRYPGIRVVLDLHRDASGDPENQFRPTAMVDGRSCAQLMMVMGSDAAGQAHPNWRENLSLALKLQVQLERLAPGITRPIDLRSQRFNQDMSPGALLIEVGSAGNTHPEALAAADLLGQALAQLAKGSGPVLTQLQ